MRVSVVIATANRARSLEVTLAALEHQTHRDFEVIVVKGPGTDDTAEVLAAREDRLRWVENPERNLCKSRNLGIDLAAGEIVAFIDDDGIPEPCWLEQLMAAYADPGVGGAGGLVYDQTGVHLQYRYAVCDRVGRTDFDRRPPFDEFNRPGADPFVYLQGTNMSFRREALAALGGFDENIEYIWDEADLALHLIDAGWRLEPIAGAAVHHKLAPSHLRRERGQVTDPFTPVKNRAYFALRNGPGHRPLEEVFRSLTDYVDMLRELAADSERHGRFSKREARHFVERLAAGFETGVELGMSEPRAGRPMATPDPGAFLRYPVRVPEGERLSICFVSLDYPPAPMGGIARYTADLAQGLGAQGHEVHVVTRADPPWRLDFEQGVWVHRHPEGERLLPHLDGHPLRDNLVHVAATWQAVRRVHERFPLDAVVGNVWLAEPLLCAVDPRWPVVMVCSTPMRTIADTQPAVAAKAITDWQVALEDVAMVRAQQLMPLSHANLQMVRRTTPAAAGVPAEVVWLGMVDRAGRPLPPPADRDPSEILFVGRLEPRKGVETLLDAAIPLLRERPGVRLRLAGADNPYASDDPRPYAERVAERLAGEPELRRRIVFEGEVSDAVLDDLLRACHVFCAPSRYESFGLMNVEAMMFSRPVVSTAAGGIPEVVADGETGLLVAPDDPDALREALRTLVDDPELRERMGAAGRRRFEREFDLTAAVARTLALLRTTVARGAGASQPADPEAAARTAFVEVLTEFDGIADPAAAAEELLEPHAFPHDYRAAFARLAGAADRDFVAGLYEAILRRPPELEGLENATFRLESGAVTREELAREVATSDEARLLGVDPGFLESLGSVTPRTLDREVERRVRDAFWRDDETFTRLLAETLLGDGARPVVAEVQRALEAGAGRQAVLRELVGRDDVRARIPGAETLTELRFLTPAELQAELEALSGQDDAGFVAAVYRLLLDREPDPAAATAIARLQHASRRSVLIDIATAAEAAQRGVDAVVVDTVAARIPALGVTPRRGAERVPGGRRARHIGRRVLRDPRIGQIERSLAELHSGADATPERLTAEIGRRHHAMMDAQIANGRALDALERQISSLGEELGRERRRTQELLDGAQRLLEGIGRRLEAMPSEGTHGTYLGDGKVLVNTVWGGKLLVAAGDRSLTPDLVAHGIYEPPYTRYLLRALRPGQTVVDVGANVGMYTLLMASCVGDSGRVYAYEPNPDVLALLEENLTLNWIRNRVVVCPVAVADMSGATTLHVTERYMGNSSLQPLGEEYARDVPGDTLRDVEVPVEPLDARADELGRVDLVKIDVEGGEMRVLKGMAGLLERRAVEIVTFEVFRDRLGADWAEFGGLLRGYAGAGWRFSDISPEGVLEPVDVETVLAVGRYAQLVMTRQ